MKWCVFALCFIPFLGIGQKVVIYGDYNYMDKIVIIREDDYHIPIDTTIMYDLKDSLPSLHYNVYYNPDTTRLAIDGYYVDRRRAFQWYYYDGNGTLKYTIAYDSELNQISFSYRDSVLMGVLSKNSKGELHGTVIYYFSPGVTKEIGNYINGERHGLQQFYHSNGQKSEEGIMLSWHRIGKWVYWNEEGEIIKIEEHDNLPQISSTPGYITGITVGVIDFSVVDDLFITIKAHAPIIIRAQIGYTLANEEILSFKLYDISGQLLMTFIDHEPRIKGEHKEMLHLPESLAPGLYLLVIDNGTVSRSIEITKK